MTKPDHSCSDLSDHILRVNAVYLSLVQPNVAPAHVGAVGAMRETTGAKVGGGLELFYSEIVNMQTLQHSKLYENVRRLRQFSLLDVIHFRNGSMTFNTLYVYFFQV